MFPFLESARELESAMRTRQKALSTRRKLGNVRIAVSAVSFAWDRWSFSADDRGRAFQTGRHSLSGDLPACLQGFGRPSVKPELSAARWGCYVLPILN